MTSIAMRHPGTSMPPEQFREILAASGLFKPAELAAVLAGLSRDDRSSAPAMAAALIRTNRITVFQAKKLLAGLTKGLVLGHYRILAPIGKGGMGKVYLARDARHSKPVALKVLPPHKARAEERLLTRFLREMELCQTVDHPNIARAYEAGVEGGDVHFIALEFVPGMTLSRAVSTAGPLRPDVAARIFAEAADGLAHAHEAGVIHRDVKPANLMITPAGHPKILDLGLALRPGEEGDASVIGGKGYVVGTMDYVSPEQTRDARTVDFRSDLYGLGGTLYYALTGRPPFPGGTGKDKINRQRNEAPPRVEEYNGDVPIGLANLIDELLSKSPEDRPESAEVVRDRLLKWSGRVAPPDAPPDTLKILASLSALPRGNSDDDSEVKPIAQGKDWTKWAIISGVSLLLIAVLALIVQMYR